MSNLMITHGGALGDNGFTIPALIELRKRYGEVYLSCCQKAVTALKDTGLIDRFLVRHPDMEEATEKQKRSWLLHMVSDIDFHAKLNFNNVLPGRYVFHRDDPKFPFPPEWKRENADGVSFFDAFSERAGTLEAIGRRPEIFLTHKDRSWLRDFRYIYNIPKDAFLLGWQFTGNAKIKWYPFFDIVVQKGIMRKYPQVYVIGLGDIENRLTWDRRLHGGRFINLGDSVSFRQAYILTSILDCLVAPETGIMVFAQAWAHVPKIMLSTHTYGYHITFDNSTNHSTPETVIIQSEAECSPCYNIVFDCMHDGDNPWTLCMGKISPEKVIAAIDNVILDTGTTHRGRGD
ncbi:glycosyltransferase family 9 protein [Candidatus Poribacteria bacterium]